MNTAPDTASPPPSLQVVLITGMSGSGKSVALHALEDSGFYCVDNLPPELLEAFIEVERRHQADRVAVAIDVRSAASLPGLPQRLSALRNQGVDLTVLFLDATDAVLVRRYSETRRMHPLSVRHSADQHRALLDALVLERELLATLRDGALVIDTSQLKAAQLRTEVKSLLLRGPAPLSLVFESFAFKRGIPMDADFVFDARMLPNPHYEPELRPLTGLDAPVAAYLAAEPEVAALLAQITAFLERWLPAMVRDHRSYVTVAVGCTGGQHRSVYLVERLAAHFAPQWSVQRRHRELDVRLPDTRVWSQARTGAGSPSDSAADGDHQAP
ncbi:RNase adapter protein RapZ [Tepidimonas thermarum]|uniref:RNase adapter protein RapZ n=1 Tax=Tepidimonas thermarum TaxID=335431 RepID=A0A554X104_9BURK|nr:RNase adapter protein RapZ [Tepidimonas thermarum]